MKLQDQYAAALLKLGAVEVLPSPTGKARTFDWLEHQRYYLGRGGSFRRGSTYTKSIPVGDGFKEKLLKEWGN